MSQFRTPSLCHGRSHPSFEEKGRSVFFGCTPTTTSASSPRACIPHTRRGIYSRSTSASCFATASAAQSPTLWSASDFRSCGLGVNEEEAGVDGRRRGASRSSSPTPDTSVGGRAVVSGRRFDTRTMRRVATRCVCFLSRSPLLKEKARKGRGEKQQ